VLHQRRRRTPWEKASNLSKGIVARRSHLLKQVRQGEKKPLVTIRWRNAVRERNHVFPKTLTEEEGLEDRIAVARVPEVL
jgi:hypothetical protein